MIRRKDFILQAAAGALCVGCTTAQSRTGFASVPGDVIPLGVITYSFASMPLRPFAVAQYAK